MLLGTLGVCKFIRKSFNRKKKQQERVKDEEYIEQEQAKE